MASHTALFSFPSVINAIGNWGLTKHFSLYGETKETHLASVVVYMGFNDDDGLLGERPGIVLYAGSGKHAPVLGAVSDESVTGTRTNMYHRNSIVFLPHLDTDSPVTTSRMVTEVMRANTDTGRSVFRFSVECGKDVKRENFEWRRVNKGEDENIKLGGFKLIWIKASSGSNETGPTTGNGEEETVAIMASKATWFGSRHFFELQFTGTAKMGLMGDRWALMAVLTSLRLCVLKWSGLIKKDDKTKQN